MKHDRHYAVALGFFDGVHRAHRQVLRLAREASAAHGLRCAALTFDRHPGSALTGRAVPLLQTQDERIRMLREDCGMDEVFVLPFTRDMQEMAWDRFLDDILIGRYGAAFAAAGYDFRFGYRGEGNAQKLGAYCSARGVGSAFAGKIRVGGVVVGSSAIREYIRRGELTCARQLLGYPYTMAGEVLHGKRLGRLLAMPTMNMRVPAALALPPDGVYLTRTWVDGVCRPSVTSLAADRDIFGGTAGTAAGGRLVESHVLGFDRECYGEEIRVEFLRLLRVMVRFDSADALRARLDADRRAAELYFGNGLDHLDYLKETGEWEF